MVDCGSGQFYWARYYSPQFGRFMSEDPIGFNGGDANLYRYVWNSPTNFRDPLGLWGVGASVGGTIAGGGGPGAGGSASVGGVFFPGQGTSAGYATAGSFEGPNGGFFGNYDGNQTGGFVYSAGPGFVLTNGRSAQDISGSFNNTSYSLALLHLDFAYSPDTGVWTLNVSTGFGLGFSKFCTNTYTNPTSEDSFSKPVMAGRHCGCDTMW